MDITKLPPPRAHCLAEPFDCPDCIPIAYSLALYSVLSTVLVVSVAQSLALPPPEALSIPVPPVAHALEEYSEPVIAPSTFIA